MKPFETVSLLSTYFIKASIDDPCFSFYPKNDLAEAAWCQNRLSYVIMHAVESFHNIYSD